MVSTTNTSVQSRMRIAVQQIPILNTWRDWHQFYKKLREWLKTFDMTSMLYTERVITYADRKHARVDPRIVELIRSRLGTQARSLVSHEKTVGPMLVKLEATYKPGMLHEMSLLDQLHSLTLESTGSVDEYLDRHITAREHIIKVLDHMRGDAEHILTLFRGLGKAWHAFAQQVAEANPRGILGSAEPILTFEQVCDLVRAEAAARRRHPTVTHSPVHGVKPASTATRLRPLSTSSNNHDSSRPGTRKPLVSPHARQVTHGSFDIFDVPDDDRVAAIPSFASPIDKGKAAIRHTAQPSAARVPLQIDTAQRVIPRIYNAQTEAVKATVDQSFFAARPRGQAAFQSTTAPWMASVASSSRMPPPSTIPLRMPSAKLTPAMPPPAKMPPAKTPKTPQLIFKYWSPDQLKPKPVSPSQRFISSSPRSSPYASSLVMSDYSNPSIAMLPTPAASVADTAVTDRNTAFSEAPSDDAIRCSSSISCSQQENVLSSYRRHSRDASLMHDYTTPELAASPSGDPGIWVLPDDRHEDAATSEHISISSDDDEHHQAFRETLPSHNSMTHSGHGRGAVMDLDRSSAGIRTPSGRGGHHVATLKKGAAVESGYLPATSSRAAAIQYRPTSRSVPSTSNTGVTLVHDKPTNLAHPLRSGVSDRQRPTERLHEIECHSPPVLVEAPATALPLTAANLRKASGTAGQPVGQRTYKLSSTPRRQPSLSPTVLRAMSQKSASSSPARNTPSSAVADSPAHPSIETWDHRLLTHGEQPARQHPATQTIVRQRSSPVQLPSTPCPVMIEQGPTPNFSHVSSKEDAGPMDAGHMVLPSSPPLTLYAPSMAALSQSGQLKRSAEMSSSPAPSAKRHRLLELPLPDSIDSYKQALAQALAGLRATGYTTLDVADVLRAPDQLKNEPTSEMLSPKDEDKDDVVGLFSPIIASDPVDTTMQLGHRKQIEDAGASIAAKAHQSGPGHNPSEDRSAAYNESSRAISIGTGDYDIPSSSIPTSAQSPIDKVTRRRLKRERRRLQRLSQRQSAIS